jgi:hypothetical protein
MLFPIIFVSRVKKADRSIFEGEATRIGPLYRCLDREKVAGIMNRNMDRAYSKVDHRLLNEIMVVRNFIVKKVGGVPKLLVAMGQTETYVEPSHLFNPNLFEGIPFEMPKEGDFFENAKTGKRYSVNHSDMGFVVMTPYNDPRSWGGIRVDVYDIHSGLYRPVNKPAQVKLRVKAHKPRTFRYNLIARLKAQPGGFSNVRWETPEEHQLRKHMGAFGMNGLGLASLFQHRVGRLGPFRSGVTFHS